MASVIQPYHERRSGERRRIAYPGGVYRTGLFSTEGVKVSWGGIFGGVMVAVGLLLLLAALGVAIGITAVDRQATQLGSLGVGAAIWTGASLLLALFLGGLVSSRLGATYDRTTSFFEGFLVWIVSLLLVAYLAASGMSWIAGDTFGIVGSGPDMSMAVPPDVVQGITPQAAKTAWITFGSLILSLGAALIGAMAGRRRQPISTGT
ncbi:MAG: hypothetical protein JOZ85_17685 [Betaproteobacteria bacterium]|nr:hypothetical protein [Betaproteobacteria bacterium]